MDDWSAGRVLLYPYKMGWDSLKRASGVKRFVYDKRKHLLETAREWKAQAAHYKGLSSNDIALQVGLSSSRVRQILRMNNLSDEIQDYILQVIDEHGITSVPERMLRTIAQEKLHKQLPLFERLLSQKSLKLTVRPI